MTIAAAYLVSEGVVLGADSSTTVQVPTSQGTGVVQLLTHSQKVFEVGSNSRFGICTWGAGNIGPYSHRTLIAQLADMINEKTTIEDAANKFADIVMPKMKENNIPFVGYYLGGWQPQTHKAACCHIELTPEEKKINPLMLGLCSFSGNPTFFTRVFRGFDPRLCNKLSAELNNMGITVAGNEDKIRTAFEKAAEPLASVGFQDLPIREAIDFIYSYLHITVKAEKFKFGPPSCGGPIEIGFISTDRLFRWVRHKPFYSAMIEQEGEDDDV
jgi:hypothetical protein